MKLTCSLKRILNNIQSSFRRNGSGTLVVVISSLIFTMYVSSTYADVRHLKYMEEQYEKNIINSRSVDVDKVDNTYEKVI